MKNAIYVYEEALATSLLEAKSVSAANQLKILMSDVSEDYYCAGWLIGLEYKLWDVIHGGDPKFGLGVIEPWQIKVLKDLNKECGGWWAWIGDGADSGEIFFTTEEWLKMYNSEERQ